MRRPGREQPWLVGKIEIPRAADVLAGQLRQRILTGELAEGDVLPTERNLVDRTGLGRASVREALRMLEAENLVESRLGRYGGWVVRKPGRESVARSIDVFIRGHQIRFVSLLDAREAIEPACAALAARYRTDQDLGEIEHRQAGMVAAWPDVPMYLLENVRWHLAVVVATHNELLIAFMSALSNAVHAATELEHFHSKAVQTAAIRAHEGVMAAIRDQDEQAAFRRMYRHVHAFRLHATGEMDVTAARARSRRTRSKASGPAPRVRR
jgi:GntR family transcriptional regulator, transcriptional repressor for pyruvate dehydrogenase complex